MSSTFNAKSYSGTVEHLPNCVARFKVLIDKDEVAALKNRASKAINKEVNVPGFRKGKAPDDLIMKQYGKHVDSEFKELSVRSACKEAMEATKVYPLKQDIGIELEKLQPLDDGKVEVTFRYETYPVVPDVKVDEIKIEPVEAKKVTDHDIEHTIRQIQLYHGHFHEAHDRPIQEEDFVIVDIDVIDEPPFKAYENSRFQVTEKGMPEWARKLVLGKKVGDTVEGMSEKDKDSPADFVPRKCRVLIRDVQTAHLPEVNDDLARKAGAQNVEDLKKNIEAQQTKQHNDEKQMA
ncbi:MAG: trigger factor, partial [Parachlamydiaceae bacterium]